MSLEKKLFLVRFKMDNFVDAQSKSWDGVPITLLIDEDTREPLVPYEAGIKDYDSDKDPRKEHALRSLFSEDEALRLVSYLKEHEGHEAEIDEVALPIDSIFPWYTAADPTRQGFMGVSASMCSHIGFRIAAYFDICGSVTWKEMHA